MRSIEKYYDNTESEKPRKNVEYFIDKKNAIQAKQLN